MMLAAVQTVRPALEGFYRSLSDEQKARFNAIAPTDDANAAGKDQRDLANFCDEKSPASPTSQSTASARRSNPRRRSGPRSTT